MASTWRADRGRSATRADDSELPLARPVRVSTSVTRTRQAREPDLDLTTSRPPGTYRTRVNGHCLRTTLP